MMKKLMLGAAALAVTAAPIAASAEPFGHDYGGRGDYHVAYRSYDRDGWRGDYRDWRGDYRGYRDHDDDAGAALAAGLFGFVLGNAIASNHGYYQDCYLQTRPVIGPYGYVHYERVEVCR
jgi:hypothetical protein